MKSESSMILSVPQIRLCMNVLGMDGWDDLPLVETDEAPEQRFMNAFLELVEMGRMIPEQGKYRMEPALQRQMELIGAAGKVYHLCDGERILAFLYETEGTIVMVSPDWGNPGFCRIRCFSDVSAHQIREAYAEEQELAVNAELRDAETKDNNTNVEKLMFFLEIPRKPEEIE